MARLDAFLSRFSQYYDQRIDLNGDTPISSVPRGVNRLYRRLIVLQDQLNSQPTPENLLGQLQKQLGPGDVVVAVIHNSYYQYFFTLLQSLFGIRRNSIRHRNFITRRSLQLLAQVSGLEVASLRPVHRFGWMRWVPVLRWSANHTLAFLRRKTQTPWKPSVSIVVPLRNERGNLEAIFSSLSTLEFPLLEVIFVEGGSSDGTWEQLQVCGEQSFPFQVKLLRQNGVGKADAVREGFAYAQNDLLMILDGDLSVETRELAKFYDWYAQGNADLLVGTRLLFPFEAGAMRPLNFIGNLFFAKLVNLFLGVQLTDLLCGTKVVSRADYSRICLWRARHQFVDPFGDFELIFAAAAMGLRIDEIPVHYRARTYGQTNIRRFRDGLRLLKMTLQAALLKG